MSFGEVATHNSLVSVRVSGSVDMVNELVTGRAAANSIFGFRFYFAFLMFWFELNNRVNPSIIVTKLFRQSAFIKIHSRRYGNNLKAQ